MILKGKKINDSYPLICARHHSHLTISVYFILKNLVKILLIEHFYQLLINVVHFILFCKV